MNFKKFLEQNTVGKHNDFATSAFLPSDWTGTETNPLKNLPFLSSTDLQIPQTIVNSFIKNIVYNKNPIIIELKDQTKIFLSLDQYKRLNKEPEIGQRITIIFQRDPNDFSSESSKIEKIIIH
jgi:hypothetical protein